MSKHFSLDKALIISQNNFNKRYSDLTKTEVTSDEQVQTSNRRSTNVIAACRLFSCVDNLIWICCVTDRNLLMKPCAIGRTVSYCALTIWCRLAGIARELCNPCVSIWVDRWYVINWRETQTIEQATGWFAISWSKQRERLQSHL